PCITATTPTGPSPPTAPAPTCSAWASSPSPTGCCIRSSCPGGCWPSIGSRSSPAWTTTAAPACSGKWPSAAVPRSTACARPAWSRSPKASAARPRCAPAPTPRRSAKPWADEPAARAGSPGPLAGCGTIARTRRTGRRRPALRAPRRRPRLAGAGPAAPGPAGAAAGPPGRGRRTRPGRQPRRRVRPRRAGRPADPGLPDRRTGNRPAPEPPPGPGAGAGCGRAAGRGRAPAGAILPRRGAPLPAARPRPRRRQRPPALPAGPGGALRRRCRPGRGRIRSLPGPPASARRRPPAAGQAAQGEAGQEPRGPPARRHRPRRRRAQIDYDPAAEEALFRQLLHMPPDTAAQADEGPAPVFILGQPRSGTTLLERILGGAPEVADAGELRDFGYQARVLTGLPGSGMPDLALLQALESADLAELGRRYLAHTRWRAGGKRYYTDKLPANFVWLGHIARALPQARFLHLVREPMDVCFSNLKELFANAYPHSYDQVEMAGHFCRYHRLMAHWRQAFPERVLDVEYQALVTDPEGQARRVLA